MNFQPWIILKSALLSTTLVFFFWIFIILISLIGTWGMEHVTRNEHFWTYLGYSVPYFISFVGSVCLMIYFFRKAWGSLIYVIPFSIITTFGFFVSATQFIHLNTTVQWPWHITTDSLLYYNNLLLTPAMTFMLFPLIRQTKNATKIAYKLLLVLSGLSLIFLILQINECVLPLLDPEFIMSDLWDFNPSNMILGIASGLFTFFGLMLVGVISLLVIFEFSREHLSAEGGS